MSKFVSLVTLTALVSFASAEELLRLDANDPASLTLSGASVLGWRNGVGAQTFTPTASAPTFVPNVRNGQAAIRFEGLGGLRAYDFGASASSLTVVIVAAPRVNAGGYQAFLSDSVNGADDYATGLNVDLTSGRSGSFDRVNVEGVKGGGGAGFGGSNLRTDRGPFGEFHVLTLTYGASATLFVDGREEGSYATASPAASVVLDDLRIGSRYYADTERGFFDGDIAEIRIFGETLDASSRGMVERELGRKYAVPVPEPASFAAIGLGLCVLLKRRRR